MRLQMLKVRNFRSLKELDLRFPDSGLLVLVGANNAGKSNIIKALDAICGEFWFGRDKLQDHDHYLRDPKNEISIELQFDNRHSVQWVSTGSRWPEYFDAEHRKIFRTTTIKDDFPCIYLGADRTFDKHLAFHEWSLIGKIRRAFHQQARPIETKLNEKFKELVGLFESIESFAAFKNDFATFFSDMQADTPAKLAIDFQPYTPSNYFKTMQIVAEDPARPGKLDVEELGEGSRNIVLLALLRSYAKNFKNQGNIAGILALEEPEIYMHPQARRALFRVLQEIVSSGMQVVISTHSASFVDTELFDSIGRVVKVEDDENDGCFHTQIGTVTKRRLVKHCIETGVPATKTTVENIGEFYKTTANPMLNEAFFARLVVLVEGDTEELALPVYLSHVGIDCDLRGVSIISVRGKSQIPKYWRLFSAFQIPMLVVIDNDNGKDKAQSNKTIAECFGVQVDDLIQGVNVCKRVDSPRPIGTPIVVLDVDFETALSRAFTQSCTNPERIGAWDAEARELIKPLRDQNKGQVARFIAKRICACEPTFVPQFIREIADVLTGAGLGIVPSYPDSVPSTTEQGDFPVDDFPIDDMPL